MVESPRGSGSRAGDEESGSRSQPPEMGQNGHFRLREIFKCLPAKDIITEVFVVMAFNNPAGPRAVLQHVRIFIQDFPLSKHSVLDRVASYHPEKKHGSVILQLNTQTPDLLPGSKYWDTFMKLFRGVKKSIEIANTMIKATRRDVYYRARLFLVNRR